MSPNHVLHRLLDSPWLRPLNDPDAWDRLLQRIDPLWSLGAVRARITARVDEDEDTVSLWLEPNRHWRGHRPGQHVAIGVNFDGVLRHRVFSLSCAADRGGPLRVTFRRQPGQGVTDWLHRHAGPGMVLELSQAQGRFVLPDPVPDRLLMIAAGSGITPLIAMLGQLAARGHRGDILLLQLDRDPSRILFRDELARLQHALPGLHIQRHHSAESGRFQAATLGERVADLAARHTLMCGPPALMAAVGAFFADQGIADRLHREAFSPPRPEAVPGQLCRITATESEQLFTQSAAASLLESAEAAGLAPRYGCRAGLCRTCLCLKKQGEVRNLLTGQRSAEPDEWIQLCVSVAESDLELAL